MNTTTDFNVLSVFMSFESVTYLHYFVSSDRAVCIIFSLIPRHIIPSSRVYLSQTRSIMSVFVTDSQYHECICFATRSWQSVRRRICRLTYWRRIRFRGG